jgi:hypothetical protein
MANLPAYIYKGVVENNDEKSCRLAKKQVTFFYCSVCDSIFHYNPNDHCVRPRHFEKVQKHRVEKEDRMRTLEREIAELRIKHQEKEEAIAKQRKDYVDASIQKEIQKIIFMANNLPRSTV